MAPLPRVSVILPTYNRLGLLPRAIDSVLGQSFRDLELIVVDDGSTDGTGDYVRGLADPRVVYRRRERPGGVAAARNFGVAAARGELLAFQDSDDEWLPEKLQRQVQLLDQLGTRHALVGGTVLRNLGGPVVTVCWPLEGAGPEVDRHRLVRGVMAYIQSALVRRTCFDAVGGFDEAMTSCEDWELCIRLAKSHRLAALDAAVVRSHETPGGLASRHDLRRASLLHALARHPELAGDPVLHADLLYAIARADFHCDDAGAGRRHAWQAAMRRPLQLRAWALLAVSLLGAHVLRSSIALSQGARLRLKLHR